MYTDFGESYEVFVRNRAFDVALTVAPAAALAIGTRDAKATFPGTPGAIAFASDRGGNFEIYQMGNDGSNPQVFEDEGLAGNSTLPAYSRDGSRIAFTNDKSCFGGPACDPGTGFTPNASIYRGDAVSSNSIVAYTENDSPAKETEAAWYPGQLRIAFTSDLTGSGDIYYQPLDENASPELSPVRLTRNAAFDGEAAVSPDGTKLAFTSDRDGDREIFAMWADGTLPVKLADNTAAEADPSWQPLP